METELFIARVGDTADICEKTSRPKYMSFLSAEQAALASDILSKRGVDYAFWGGYEAAERCILGCFPDWMEEKTFPVSPITFSYRKSDVLRHKDFLGSLMALGIKRETVGDILIEDGRAVAFVHSEIAEYILSEVTKIGRTGVTAALGFAEPFPQKNELKEFVDTVSSLRLDCVVSAIAGVSRATAAEKINDGFVAINSVTVQKITKTVTDGDIVTVRGSGKFIIDSVLDRTRKDRIILKYRKYV